MIAYDYEDYEEYVDESVEEERDFDELVEEDALSAEDAAILRGCEEASYRESDDEEEDY